MVIKKIAKALMILTLAVIVFFIGVKLVDWIRSSTTLNLSDVIVGGNQLLNTKEVLNLIPVEEGQNITNIDLEKIKKAIEKHPFVKTALISRKFPSALQIDVVERVPVAIISGAQKIYTVDKDGVLLPVLKSMTIKGFPVITGIPHFKEKTGEKIGSSRIIESIELFNLVRNADSDLYRSLSEVNYNNQKGFLVHFNKDKFPVYFGYDKFFEKAQKLKAFFQRVKEEKRYSLLKYVDLRFDEQVVAKFN